MAEEDLASFLAVAEDLKIDGLIAKYDKNVTETTALIDTDTHDKINEDDVAEDFKIDELNRKHEDIPTRESDTESMKNINADVLDNNQGILKEDIQDLDPVCGMEIQSMGKYLNPHNAKPNKKPDTTEDLNKKDIYENVEENFTSPPVFHNLPNDSAGKKKIQTKNNKSTRKEELNDNHGKNKKPRRNLLSSNKVTKAPIDIDNIKTQSPLKDPKQCPVCKIKLITNFPLEDHMQLKQDRQCKDCKLFFASCNILNSHKKGRCRKRNSQTEFDY